MSEPGNKKVLVEKKGPVTTMILNRPEVKNAADLETVDLLLKAFKEFEADEEARVAVLTGAGGMFCSGADLKEMASGKSIGFMWAGSENGPLRNFLRKPVIAAVAGHAVAAGLALAVWCDLRVAEEGAVFGVFCRRWGAPMTNGATIRLPRLIGMSRALDMLLTGRPVEAKEAYDIGLANRLVPKGKAREEAENLALQLAEFPQLAMLSDRESAYRQWNLSDAEAVFVEAACGKRAFAEEAQSGAARFAAGLGRHGSFQEF